MKERERDGMGWDAGMREMEMVLKRENNFIERQCSADNLTLSNVSFPVIELR